MKDAMSTSPNAATFEWNSSSPPKADTANNADNASGTMSTSASPPTSEQDHLTPTQLRALARTFALTNPDHVAWLKAEIAIEARPENSDFTAHGQDQLFRLITAKTMFVKNWLRLSPKDRAFETYQFLRYVESLTPASLSLMYTPKILNLTISDGGIDMKIRMERSDPLSPHCYVYQNRYVVTGEVLQHHDVGFNMRGRPWHSAFLWKGENFKWLRYGVEGDDRPMDTPQSVSAKTLWPPPPEARGWLVCIEANLWQLGMKDGDMIDVHVDLNVEGPCPVCHFDFNWVGTLVHQ